MTKICKIIQKLAENFSAYPTVKYRCSICGRTERYAVARYCRVWEDVGFVKIYVGITRRSYLVCRSHRDKEINEWEKTVK